MKNAVSSRGGKVYCAFQKVYTSKIFFEIGKGGDGRGMEAQMEVGLLGVDPSSTLGCGVFLDRAECPKSVQLRGTKRSLEIIETCSSSLFLVAARTRKSI